MGEKFGELTLLKVWQINRLTNRLLIVSIYLDGFSLVNDGRFTKFTKLSRYMVMNFKTVISQRN